MKNICKKTITVSIILLFIGVSGTAAISINTKSSVKEDCRCDSVNNTDLNGVEKLLDRVETYGKFLFVLSRYNPDNKEEIDRLLGIIDSNNILDFPIICASLAFIFINIGFIYLEFEHQADESPEGSIRKIIFSILENITFNITENVVELARTLNCDWSQPKI